MHILEELLRFLLENPSLIIRGFGFFIGYVSAYNIFKWICKAEDQSHAEHDNKPKGR